jgi:hypothetical protein
MQLRVGRSRTLTRCGFKDATVGRGGDEWPFRMLQGSAAAERYRESPSATGALDVDNFFETEHPKRSSIANLLQPDSRLQTSHKPHKYHNMDSFGAAGMNDPYV